MFSRRNIAILMLSIALIGLTVGCSREKGGGVVSPPFTAISDITNSCGKAVFSVGKGEILILKLVDEGSNPIQGLDVLCLSDETGAENVLLIVTDPDDRYLTYMFSPQAAELESYAGEVFSGCESSSALESENFEKRYLLKKMMSFSSVIDEDEKEGSAYYDKVDKVNKYLFDPEYGYYEALFSSDLENLDSKLKEYWDEFEFGNRTGLTRDGYLAHIAVYDDGSPATIKLNIFSKDQTNQKGDYLKNGYAVSQFFEVYQPKIKMWEGIEPFPLIKPLSGPTNTPPTVKISALPTEGLLPLEVSFKAEADDRDGTVVSYEWNFADGETSNEQNPTHIYRIGGTHKVVCKVTDNDGAEGSDSIEISASTPPTGDSGSYLVYKLSSAINGGTIEFDVKGLTNMGSTNSRVSGKDVLFCMTKGMTLANYEGYRCDIRKYGSNYTGQNANTLQTVITTGLSKWVEETWLDSKMINWDRDHTYHLTIIFGDFQFKAFRLDKDTGELIEFSASYEEAAPNGLSFTYIMFGWSPKYGTPPGGTFFDVRLPYGVDYELVKSAP